ncbi:helix-turn-helix transcriptional regulator [Morganella morganii]|uniref:ArsR/SmtB family transcription factor n=1 Tax=Morganella morganii TaxID=582 RepID=UPI0024BADB43|nr:winged helix-turn-helix domain-containing protein [Morganella morganii]BEP20427.1 winged helix-turn-helix domain-containing protein [Morganella morganii subsp. sibonii]HDS6842789.1 winged helix-turn-helix transcriptional regulator [Morganella morganii subsp. morganii]EGT3624080.1 winged helix-turn-helix transcriptional regulator [Morganella morganii]EGT3630511.1 winged helix-turn-helix transcriptional regulator [Morganella morganii]EGT3636021.1 winged helix-turn-helix transcriptional regula
MSEEHIPELETALAGVAAALADPSRIRMLCALMDGRARTATELSIAADISASTASAHLTKLVTGKLIICIPQGRHRYYQLAGLNVAEFIEKMMNLTGIPVTAAIRKSSAPLHLRQARTCYDHLAGETAVAVYDAMQEKGWITADGTALTASGESALITLGLPPAHTVKRVFCCGCLDWSERRFHLGGYLGAALFTHCEQQGWLTRTPGYREVTITGKGKKQFRQWLGIQIL